jgi:hypothetical protein
MTTLTQELSSSSMVCMLQVPVTPAVVPLSASYLLPILQTSLRWHSQRPEASVVRSPGSLQAIKYLLCQLASLHVCSAQQSTGLPIRKEGRPSDDRP